MAEALQRTVQHTVHCRILRAERIGDHTKYLICGAVDGHEYPPVRRRYREFTKIWGALREHLAIHAGRAAQAPAAALISATSASSVVLPDLPPKKMFGQMSSGFVTKRMKALERALQAVCATALFASFPRLLVFLGIDVERASRNCSVDFVCREFAGSSAAGSGHYDEDASGETTAGDDSTNGGNSSPATTATTTINCSSEAWGTLSQRDADFERQSPDAHYAAAPSASSPAALARAPSCAPSTSTKLSYIGMMRHSARLDEIPGCTWSDHSTRAYDTPICDFDLPLRAAAKCKRNRFKFEAVVSSPFRRCLQTAAIVANYMGLKMLFVDNRLGEVMSKVRSSIEQNSSKRNSDTSIADSEDSSEEKEWSYLPRDEAEMIAERAGLLLCWEEDANVPPLDESSGAFLQRCNAAKSVVEDVQRRGCHSTLIEQQLSDAKADATSLAEELSSAREHVARAAEQLTVTFAANLGLSSEAAADRMYDLYSWIQAEEDSDTYELADGEDDEEALLPVETAYQSALQRVSRAQRNIQANEARCSLLDEFLSSKSLLSWQTVLLVTHADIINQRLQYLKPNELYAPRCCGWMVEDLEAKSVLKIMDCDRIM